MGRCRGCDATAVAISSVAGDEIGAGQSEERDRVYIWREAAVGKNSSRARRFQARRGERGRGGPRKR